MFCAVGIRWIIDEGAPHDDTFVRFEGIGQHIGAFGMGASEVAWTGLSFTVCLHKETSEIRYKSVDFASFVFPPANDLFVKWVGCMQLAEYNRAGKVDGKIYPYSIRAEGVCQRLYLFQICRRKNLGRSIYIVQYSTVDTDGGIGTGIRFISAGGCVGQLLPIPERLSGIASLYGSVHVVPMVEDAKAVGRILRGGTDGQSAFLQAEQVKGSI